MFDAWLKEYNKTYDNKVDKEMRKETFISFFSQVDEEHQIFYNA